MMSYNYDQCVRTIQEQRRRAYVNANANASTVNEGVTARAVATTAPDLAALQQSIDGFANLSRHCPMTPLFWMQYARDTEKIMEGLMMLESPNDGEEQQLQTQARINALETSAGILELALGEFPGCSLLHLYYLESLAEMVYQRERTHQVNVQSGSVNNMDTDARHDAIRKLNNAFEAAWENVGKGSHVNEGMIVSEIYQLRGSFILFHLSSAVKDLKTEAANVGMMDTSGASAIFHQLQNLFQSWSKTPMGEGANDEMMQDMEYLWDKACVLLMSLCDGEQQRLQQKQELDKAKATLWKYIDHERKKTSSLTNILSSFEDEIDVAMSNEGIALPKWSFLSQQSDERCGSSDKDSESFAQALKRSNSKWDQVLLVDTNRFLLGLGGIETSRAFLKLVNHLQRTYQGSKRKGSNADRSAIDEYVARYKYSAICSLFERTMAECPTVESCWVSYIAFLRGEWIRVQSETRVLTEMEGKAELHRQLQQQQEKLSSALQSTSHRATRNCPYSSTLFEMRMVSLGLTTASNFEPDNIMAVVQEATELGFLNQNQRAMLHLRLVAILIVKRRLLSLISLGNMPHAHETLIGVDYDQAESAGSRSMVGPPSQTMMEEVQDLLDDIRDMYDEVDAYLFKSHPTWLEGKVAFWKHRALTEAYVALPVTLALRKASQNVNGIDEEKEVAADKEATSCFEKLVKAQKPSHPDQWRDYIRFTSFHNTWNKIETKGIVTSVSTLCKTRGLFHRAMSSVKKAGGEEQDTCTIAKKHPWMAKGMDATFYQRDYDTALSDLCFEYLEFERANGSEGSFSHAQGLVSSKLAHWNPPTASVASAPFDQGELHGKRKLEPPKNESSLVADELDKDEEAPNAKRACSKTNLKQPKKTDGVHKVRIGKMEYPAHPFTIHVSNLNKETQDMDLVDAFRPEFGAIVHAKILREKHFGKGGHHFHGQSKGCGLVQFQDRLSVEKSLQRDGDFEVGGKTLKIQRSHLPAVGLIPSGLHRVNPKGEGKASRRNKVRKESKTKEGENARGVDGSESMEVDDNGPQVEVGDTKQKKNPVTTSSPGSLSLSALSFKPRGIQGRRQKPKISLDANKK
ncbi:hypothetical protein ACHAWF_008050 [Thalassiosira exigua]